MGASGPRLPDVSVVIVTFNQPEVLSLQLRALMVQETSLQYEVIVSDDGSGEKSYYAFRDAALSNSELSFRYAWQPNKGFRASMARNAGIRIAKGKLLIFLDGDMVPTRYFVQKHFNAHTQDRMLVAGNRFRRSLQQLQPFTKGSDEVWMDALASQSITDTKILRWQRTEEQKRNEFAWSKHPWRICFSCNLSVPRLPEVLFDESYVGWGPDDWELAHRLSSQHGFSAIFDPDIVAYEVEDLQGASNIFRKSSHLQVVQYMRNVCHLADQCSELPPEDIYLGFDRLEFDSSKGEWRVKDSRPTPGTVSLENIVLSVRAWLSENNIYP